MLDETALAFEFREAGVGHVVPNHGSPVRDRHQERSRVEITRQGACVDLERRLARIRQVHREAVVDDAFEDGQRSYPHLIEEHAIALGEAIEAALPKWVRHCTERFGVDAGDAGERAAADLVPRIRTLLAQDIDLQRTTPLALLREAVRYPTEVLRAAGVAPVERDDHDRAMFPDDDYGLTPASFADFGDDVSSAGIAWGAAKAWTHRQRHS